jgi:TonB-linked SusC/RagA family outer membrane protein
MTLSGYHNNSTSDLFNDPKIWVDTENQSQMDNPSQFLSKVSGKSTTYNYNSWTIDNIFTYTKDIAKHHFDLMAGYTRESGNKEGLITTYSNFSTPVSLKWYVQGYSLQDNKGISRTRTRTSAVSYIARANYNYASTYYGTFNFRRDGYSAFAPGHKWGNFYGASAAWVLSNESFVKDNVSWLDYLKLRLSWGQNGSRSVSAYATTSSLSSWYTWLNNETTLGFVPSNLGNSSLTWATVTKYNLGIDFTLLKYRLDGSIDVYTGETTDMLVSRSVPYSSGYADANDNVGKVTNRGIEINLHSVNLDGDGNKSLRWESNLTFDSNTNKIKSLFGKNYAGVEADDVANATAYGFDSYFALMVGHPIGAAYDLKKLGVFQTQEEIDAYVDKDGNKIQGSAKPGDLKFEDWNGDGKISTDDRHYIGCMDPLFTVNFGNTLSYKNFSLYFSFRWEQGDSEHFLGYDPNAFSYNGGAQLENYHAWMKAGDGNKYASYSYSNSFNYQYWNQRTFLKLKDLVFSYDFDKGLINKVGLAGLRLYVSGTDLFTISGWSGLDPEDGGTIASGAASSRFGRNGTYRTINIGANITF